MGEAFALLLGGGSRGPLPEFCKKECNLVQSDQCILRLDYFSQVGLLTFILPRQGRVQEFVKGWGGGTHHVNPRAEETKPEVGVWGLSPPPPQQQQKIEMLSAKYAFSWQLGTK